MLIGPFTLMWILLKLGLTPDLPLLGFDPLSTSARSNGWRLDASTPASEMELSLNPCHTRLQLYGSVRNFQLIHTPNLVLNLIPILTAHLGSEGRRFHFYDGQGAPGDRSCSLNQHCMRDDN